MAKEKQLRETAEVAKQEAEASAHTAEKERIRAQEQSEIAKAAQRDAENNAMLAEKGRKRATGVTIIAVLFLIAALAVAVMAVNKTREVNIANAAISFQDEKFVAALESLKAAKRFSLSFSENALNEKIKYYDKQADLKPQYDKLMQNGSALLAQPDTMLLQAKEFFAKAKALQYFKDNGKAQSEINATEKRIQQAFKTYKLKGTKFYNAGEYALAAVAYRKAKFFVKDDPLVLKRLDALKKKNTN